MSAGCLLSARKLATSPRENGRIRSLFAGVDSGRNGAVCTLRPTSRLPRLTPDFPRFRSGFCSWISFADLINRVRIPVAPPNMEGQTPYVYPCGRYQLTGRNRPIEVVQHPLWSFHFSSWPIFLANSGTRQRSSSAGVTGVD